MGKSAVFISEFLHDGHLSIPETAVKTLSLKKGAKVKTVIETQHFDKVGFLKLFGIWRNKTEKEVDTFKAIIEEREAFGRGEVKL